MINLNREIANNMLLSRHKINALQILDTENQSIIENEIGNEVRLLKSYPLAYDFLTNMIDKINKCGLNDVILDSDINYYSMLVSKETFEQYFAYCDNWKVRDSLKRQLIKDLTTGYILLKDKDKTYIEMRKPFYFSAKRFYNSGQQEYEFYFSKLVFKNLVENKIGGDGYVQIPALLYPFSTTAKPKVINSVNPHYKANIFGLLKNTHKNKKTVVNRMEFIEHVIPEYARIKDGKYILKESIPDIRKDLISGLKTIRKSLNDDLLLDNLYIGDAKTNETILYFANAPKKNK